MSPYALDSFPVLGAVFWSRLRRQRVFAGVVRSVDWQIVWVRGW
jgi:hypothetical protein